MKTTVIKEGAIKLIVPKGYKLDSKMPVFYNPAQVTNRDISIILLKAMNQKFWCLDLLAGTGVRGLRIKKEVPKAEVSLNDNNPIACKLMKKNASLNKLKVDISCSNAEFRLANYKQVYNYIDIDPFGTPVPYLDAAIKAVKWNGGILAVTATDTSALCGTYLAACLRKYGAKPLRNELMHEIGLRILIKKIQEVGAQYEIALTPIFCHSTLHYMRVYLIADQGANKADEILKQHKFFQGAGPIWTGQLWDEKLAEKIAQTKADVSPETKKLIYTISQESKINIVGFFDLHAIAKRKKLKSLPKIDSVIERLRKKGYKAERTHFSMTGIRTDADLKEILKAMES